VRLHGRVLRRCPLRPDGRPPPPAPDLASFLPPPPLRLRRGRLDRLRARHRGAPTRKSPSSAPVQTPPKALALDPRTQSQIPIFSFSSPFASQVWSLSDFADMLAVFGIRKDHLVSELSLANKLQFGSSSSLTNVELLMLVS